MICYIFLIVSYMFLDFLFMLLYVSCISIHVSICSYVVHIFLYFISFHICLYACWNGLHIHVLLCVRIFVVCVHTLFLYFVSGEGTDGRSRGFPPLTIICIHTYVIYMRNGTTIENYNANYDYVWGFVGFTYVLLLCYTYVYRLCVRRSYHSVVVWHSNYVPSYIACIYEQWTHIRRTNE